MEPWAAVDGPGLCIVSPPSPSTPAWSGAARVLHLASGYRFPGPQEDAMPRSTHLARAAVVLAATLAAGACRSGSPGQPDPGPSVPPPAVAAAPASVVTDEDVQDTKIVNV